MYELDPTKKETTPGTPDSVAVEKLKSQAEQSQQDGFLPDNSSQNTENLTETEKFSRELFATVASLNQNGAVDQATIDALAISLAEQIQNSTSSKIFTLADIKTINDESVQAIQKYRDTLNSIYDKYNTEKGVPDVLEKLITDEENMSILSELDPIIDSMGKIINESVKMEVPRSLFLLHLDLINNSQRLLENINGIKLIDSDPILAMGAISQYWENSLTLESVARRLVEAIQQKLNN